MTSLHRSHAVSSALSVHSSGPGSCSRTAAARRPSAAPGKAAISRFAIQCKLEPRDDEENEAGPAAGAGEDPVMAGSTEWRALGELEYAIRLAMAECREETSHMLLAVRCLLPGGSFLCVHLNQRVCAVLCVRAMPAK